jgi:hypothetical protein
MQIPKNEEERERWLMQPGTQVKGFWQILEMLRGLEIRIEKIERERQPLTAIGREIPP